MMAIIFMYYVKVLGNARTKESFVLRVIGADTCKCVNNASLDSIKKRIKETKLFRDVRVEVIGDTVYIFLKEFWYMWPFPLIDYSFDVGLSFGLGVVHTNFRGYGEKLMGSFMFGARRSWEIAWNTPDYRFFKNSFGFGMGSSGYYSFIYRIPIHRTWINGLYTTKLSENLRMQMKIGVVSVKSDSFDIKDIFSENSIILLKDTRDWILYPKKGYAIKGGVYEYFGNFVARKFEFYYEGFMSWDDLTFVIFAGYTQLFGDPPIYILPNFIGSDDALRGGIPEHRIVGKRKYLLSFEIRRVLSERFPSIIGNFISGGFGISVFTDFGGVDTITGVSVGLGIPIFSSLGEYLPAMVYNTRYGFQPYVGGIIRIK